MDKGALIKLVFHPKRAHTMQMGEVVEVLAAIWISTLTAPVWSRQLLTHGQKMWPWWHDKRQDVIFYQTFHFFHVCSPLVINHTQSGNLYILIGKTAGILTHVVPISAYYVDSDVVLLQGHGPTIHKHNQQGRSFWEAIFLHGGSWMWDYMHDKAEDMGWLTTALEEGTAIPSTDGSYSRTRAPGLCGAGWIIACRKGWGLIKGLFYEYFSDAGSYRGELLGLVALHTLVLHKSKYYSLATIRGTIICNSQSALLQTKNGRRRVWPERDQMDIFQTLCSIHQEIPGTELTYK
jgi:hypothetical protein